MMLKTEELDWIFKSGYYSNKEIMKIIGTGKEKETTIKRRLYKYKTGENKYIKNKEVIKKIKKEKTNFQHRVEVKTVLTLSHSKTKERNLLRRKIISSRDIKRIKNKYEEKMILNEKQFSNLKLNDYEKDFLKKNYKNTGFLFFKKGDVIISTKHYKLTESGINKMYQDMNDKIKINNTKYGDKLLSMKKTKMIIRFVKVNHD